MNTIRVEAADQNTLDKAEKLLAGIDGGVNKAIRNAMAQTVSSLRVSSAKVIREKYAISTANIRAEENVTVRYSYQNGVQAFVTFAGHKIPLYRFEGSAPMTPTQDTGERARAKVRGNWRLVHPSVPASGHQLKRTSPTHFQDAFVARMKSGHIGIFERTGGATSSGSEEIREIMGSSVPQMLGGQEIMEKLIAESMENLEKYLDHEILRILNGYGG